MQLFPYQEIGRDFLASRKFACLWDEPGLGKSFQALSAMLKIGATNVVIVCPASVRMVWRAECRKIGIESVIVTKKQQINAGINIVSYEGATRFCKELTDKSPRLLIIDEGHYLKNPRTKRTTSIFGKECARNDGIGSKAAYIWSLTGTPMPNYPNELWPTFRALFPDAVAKMNEVPMNYWEFQNRYCTTYENNFGIVVTGGKNLEGLRAMVRGRCLRRKVTEVLKDLPSIRYETLPIEAEVTGLDPEEIRIMKKQLEKEQDLEALFDLPNFSSLRRLTALQKIDAIKRWVDECPYDKIVLFAHHKEVISELVKMDKTVYIDGSRTADQREKAVKDFQEGDARIFVGQITAAGTGVTLTAANILLFVEASWVPADNHQAAKRIHRIGQERSCLVYFTYIPGTVDENIMTTIKKKTQGYRDMGL